MAAINIPVAADKIEVGIESTFGTAATTAFARHVAGTVKPKLSQTEIEQNGASARLFQDFTSIQGLKSQDSGIDFAVHAKPASAVLDTGSTPATPYLGTLLKAILGTEQSGAGSTISGGASTTTVINVQAGHGSRFYRGGVILVEVSNVYYAAMVASIATDAITVWPALPGAPANGDDVINAYTYSLSESNTQSLTVKHTYTVSATDAATVQRTLLGCTGDLVFRVGLDQLAVFEFALKAADWSYGTLSHSVAVGTETMGTPIPITQGECYLQTAATTTRTNLAVLSMGFKLSSGMMLQKVVTGGVQGVISPVRSGGRASGDISLRVRADTAWHTGWSAQTTYRLLATFLSGSGTSKRAVSFACNACQILGKPVESEEGGMLVYDLTLRPVLDSSLTVDTAGGAPWSLSLT